MQFPFFAKHPDGSVWYEFISDRHFIEWKRIGPDKGLEPSKYVRSEILSKDYSTSVYISDLISAVSKGDLQLVNDLGWPHKKE